MKLRLLLGWVISEALGHHSACGESGVVGAAAGEIAAAMVEHVCSSWSMRTSVLVCDM